MRNPAEAPQLPSYDRTVDEERSLVSSVVGRPSGDGYARTAHAMPRAALRHRISHGVSDDSTSTSFIHPLRRSCPRPYTSCPVRGPEDNPIRRPRKHTGGSCPSSRSMVPVRRRARSGGFRTAVGRTGVGRAFFAAAGTSRNPSNEDNEKECRWAERRHPQPERDGHVAGVEARTGTGADSRLQIEGHTPTSRRTSDMASPAHRLGRPPLKLIDGVDQPNRNERREHAHRAGQDRRDR